MKCSTTLDFTVDDTSPEAERIQVPRQPGVKYVLAAPIAIRYTPTPPPQGPTASRAEEKGSDKGVAIGTNLGELSYTFLVR